MQLRENEIVDKLLAGASLHCVMQPDDEIPTNRPLHDECLHLPHIIIDGDKFSAVTARDIVTKPGIEWPIVFYYTNYREMFGTLDPTRVEPGMDGDNRLRMYVSPRKRYKKFDWLLYETWTKIWDSQGKQDIESVRSAVLQAMTMKAVFMDEEDVWNIHPIVLPQVACKEDAFILQAGYITYPFFFRQTQELEAFLDSDEFDRYFEDDKLCFTNVKEIFCHPFYAFYHLYHDGTYKSYYDLSRGTTAHNYQRLMIFADK